jgi:hypothetical protein
MVAYCISSTTCRLYREFGGHYMDLRDFDFLLLAKLRGHCTQLGRQ